MKKILSFTALSILCVPFFAQSSNAAKPEEHKLSSSEMRDGSTTLDRAIPQIEVRLISPFRYRDKLDDKKTLDDPTMVATARINPIILETLIGKPELKLEDDEEVKTPGAMGLDITFSKGFREAMDAMKAAQVRGEEDVVRGLCSGPRISRQTEINDKGEEVETELVTMDLEKRLKDCANFYPAEYTVAVNYFQTYTTWKAKENEALFDYYMTKLQSDRFMDRIESRLMIDCLSNVIGTGSVIGKGSIFQVADDFVGEKTQRTDDSKYGLQDEKDETFTSYTSDGSEVTLTRKVYEVKRRPIEVAGVESSAALARCTIPYYWDLGSLFKLVDLDSCDLSKESAEEIAPLIDEGGTKIIAYNEGATNALEIDEEAGKATVKTTHEHLDKVNTVFVELTNNQTINYAFDFPTYIKRCVMTDRRAIYSKGEKAEDRKLPTGTKAAIELIPYLRLELVKGNPKWYNPETSGTDEKGEKIEGMIPSRFAETLEEKSVIMRIKTYPMSIAADELYDALRSRVLKIITSKGFISGETDGWIPSPFAPDDWSRDKYSENDEWRTYCSIRLPIKLIQQINAFSNIHYKDENYSDDKQEYKDQRVTFAWKLLADRIALLQTLEVMLGAVQIAQESERMLWMLDKDLHRLIEPSIEFLQVVVDGYKSSINLSYATAIEDIIALLAKFDDDWKEAQSMQAKMKSDYELLKIKYPDDVYGPIEHANSGKK